MTLEQAYREATDKARCRVCQGPDCMFFNKFGVQQPLVEQWTEAAAQGKPWTPRFLKLRVSTMRPVCGDCVTRMTQAEIGALPVQRSRRKDTAKALRKTAMETMDEAQRQALYAAATTAENTDEDGETLETHIEMLLEWHALNPEGTHPWFGPYEAPETDSAEGRVLVGGTDSPREVHQVPDV